MRPIRVLPGRNRGTRLDSGGPGARHEQGFVKAWLETGALMPRGGIYQAILWVLTLTVVAGAEEADRD